MSKYAVTGTFTNGVTHTLEFSTLGSAMTDFEYMEGVEATDLSLTVIDDAAKPEPEKTIQDVLADAPQGTMYYYTESDTLNPSDPWEGVPIIVSPGMYHYNGKVKPISESGGWDNPETKLAKNWTIKYPR